MKTTVTRDGLYPALARVAPLAPSIRTIPVMGCVRLETGSGGLSIVASDFDCWLSERVDEEPREAWAGCVDAERFAGLVKSLVGEITLEADDGMLTIAGDGVSARLSVLPGDDFPSVPSLNEPTRFEIAAGELTTTLRFCGHAASKESHRFWLCGVRLRSDGVAAGCDGHRLAVRRIADGLELPEGGITVPLPTCNRLTGLLRGLEGAVAVEVTPRLVRFTGGTWVLTGKLLDASYPEIERVLAPRSERPAVVDRAALVAACSRIGLLAAGKTHGMRIDAAGTELTASGGSVGALVDQIISSAGPVDTVSLGLNAHFLAEALAAIGTDRAELHLTRGSPIWVCAAGETHDGITIMPMRLDDN